MALFHDRHADAALQPPTNGHLNPCIPVHITSRGRSCADEKERLLSFALYLCLSY